MILCDLKESVDPLSKRHSKSEIELDVVEFKGSVNLPAKTPKAKYRPQEAHEQKSLFSRAFSWAAGLGQSCWIAEFGDLGQDHYASWDPYNIQGLEDSVEENFLTDKTPKEAFFECVKQGNWDAIQYFIHEPSFNNKSVDDKGNTALHIAAREGHADIADMLLDNDLRSKIRNNSGQTTLHLAASQGHAKCMKVLLNHKKVDRYNRFIENYSNQTPIDVALEGGFDEVAALIDPEAIPLIKKQLTKGALAHFFNIRSLHSIYRNLEGATTKWMLTVLSGQFKAMLKHPLKGDFWSNNKEALEEYFAPLLVSWRNIDNITSKNVLECIEKGIPCSIPSGFISHYVSVNVFGDWVAIGNRGGLINSDENVSHLNQPGIVFYHIPNIQETFTSEFIQRLLDCDKTALQEIQNQATPENKRLYHPRIRQKRGNCTYASGKLDIEAQLFFFVAQQMGIRLEDLSSEQDPLWEDVQIEVERLYKDFTTFGRILLFNEFSDNYANPEVNTDQWLVNFLYKKIEAIALSRELQALDICDDKGKTASIIEQLSPEGRDIAYKTARKPSFWSRWFCTVLREISEL